MGDDQGTPGRSSGRLWDKGGASSEWVLRFTVGDDYVYDTALMPFDIVATGAHVRGLLRIGVLTEDEAGAIGRCLDELAARSERGEIAVTFEDEDCHTVIEKHLTDRLGEAGKKVHTGRSRNDQVLAALRLFERDRLHAMAADAISLAGLLLDRAEDHDDWLMPGYTHTQRAMPSTVGLWFAGFAELLIDDAEFAVFAADVANRSPLGTGAGYGIPHLDLDRTGVADELFDGRMIHNCTAVQLGRGKVESLVATSAVQSALTLNRLASDLILFASQDFGFVSFPDDVTTGSSIMPHKKNPDVLEIIRASYHRVAADASLLSSVAANLSSGYHRDLQLTKGGVMRALETAHQMLEATLRFVPAVTFDRARLDAAVTGPMLTAGNALKSAREGVAFRDAYRESAQGADRPSAADILSTYNTEGSPGQASVSPLRRRIAALVSRLPT